MVWAFYLSEFAYYFILTSLLQLLSGSLLSLIHLVYLVSWPSHRLFLLPEMVFLQIATWLFSYVKVFAQISFFICDAFSDNPN